MIYDITPFTTLDYPNELACIVWVAGCNMKCKYCYNTDIIKSKGGYGIDYLKDFLLKRKGLLTGVVFSGGECTLDNNLIEYIELAKTLNFKTKVDSNGSNPKAIKKIINLVDYFAIDFKGLDYKKICGVDYFNQFIETLKTLIEKKSNFEIRTTWHFDLLNIDDILEMNKILRQNGYKNKYYLQKFLDVNNLYNLKQSNKIVDLKLLNDDFELRNFN